MRIAIDASLLEPPCPTGVERAAAGIVAALPAALATEDPPGADLGESCPQHARRAGDEMWIFTRAPVAGLPTGPRVHAAALGGLDAPIVWREARLAPALDEIGADVLWSGVTAIPLRTSVPCVATFHEAPWLVRSGMEGFLRERAHALRLRVAADRAARIVCPSRTSAAQLTRLHPGAAERVRVVAHGIDARFLAAGDDAAAAGARRALGVEGPYFLQVGGVRARKNVLHLLRAFARYRLRGGQASLVVAGPGSLPDGAPRGAISLGWIDDAALVALYDGAVALAIASESEGFGLPVLEAFARGVPVVACAAEGVVEAAGDAAAIVPHGDPDAFAAALLRVERDPAFRALLVERGRRRAASFRWDESARALLAVLREAAATTLPLGTGPL